MTKVFIDGSAGTTGLRIHERLAERKDLSLLILSDEDRKNPEKRREMLNAADIAFLCLPDAAAIEAVELAKDSKVRIIDTSTAHRTNPAWAYGFAELADLPSLQICAPGSRLQNWLPTPAVTPAVCSR